MPIEQAPEQGVVTEPVVEAVVEPVVELTAEQQAEAEAAKVEPEAELTFDELMAAFDESGDEMLSGKENFKGVPTDQVMAALEDIPEAKKLFGNLRRMATQKSQEAAATKKEYEAKMVELEERSSSLLSSDFNRQLEEILKPAEEGAEPTKIDPFNEESVRAAIQSEAKKVAAEMFKQQLSELNKAKVGQESARAYEVFKAQHPEIEQDEYQKPIAELLNRHASLSLQEAWDIVDVAKQRTRASEQEKELTALRERARESGLRTGGGSRVNNVDVPADVLEGDIGALFSYLERSQT